VLSEKVKSIRNMRDHRLLRREVEATLLQECLDQRFDFVFQEFLGGSRDDEVIGQADEVDLGADLRVPVPDITRKRGPQTGSALHVMLAKRFRVTVDQQCLPMVGRSTENHGHQRYVPKVWIAEV